MKQFLQKLIALWALLGGALILVVVVLTAINAAGFTANFITRIWGSNVPGLPGYEDAVTMFIGVAALSMFPYCQMTRGHAAVDVFMEHAPPWANHFVDLISKVLVCALALFLAYMLIQGVGETRGDRVETAVLGWPVWGFMATSVISCVLWALAVFITDDTITGNRTEAG